MTRILEINRLGAQGDGIADTPDGPVFVPFALPGERIEGEISGKRAAIRRVHSPSAGRVPAICRHFGTCGGCALQHMAPDAYLSWKRDQLVQSLQRFGIDIEPDAITPCKAGSRRRAVFSARNTAGGTMLGFNEAASHAIVDIVECPVLVPEIVEALSRLRSLAALFGKTRQPMRMTVTASKSGLDVGIVDVDTPSDRLKRDISQLAIDVKFARVSVDGETIIEPLRPVDGIRRCLGPVTARRLPAGGCGGRNEHGSACLRASRQGQAGD